MTPTLVDSSALGYAFLGGVLVAVVVREAMGGLVDLLIWAHQRYTARQAAR